MSTTTSPDFDMDDYQFPLPGFRFHPTDEELVDYYLRRKVEKKSIALELIKQIDIYRHNPWDLPWRYYRIENNKGDLVDRGDILDLLKALDSGGTMGEKECYVFVKRGRKYKNSVRPNRVTGAGFWKATGIDKPIYSQSGQGNQSIGLKKTLVFYKGSAGRGVKTEWMMHEFRLPPTTCSNSHFAKTINDANQEAEIWTLCRIFKRSVRSAPNWKEIQGGNNRDMKTKTCSKNSVDQCYNGGERASYISFSSNLFSHETKPWDELTTKTSSKQPAEVVSMSPPLSVSQSPASSGTDLFGCSDDWDELRSIVNFAFDPFYNNP